MPQNRIDLLEGISARLARHKLIPFLGAGVSAPQLGVNWNSIAADMASELGLPFSGGTEELRAIPQAFLDQRGAEALCDRLRQSFVKDNFDDSLGAAHLQIMSLHVGTIYTTNQDNLFELCTTQYGRPYRPIVTLDDLAESSPSEFLYMKYHGDLGTPESVIFTKSSYDQRISDLDHFMNIRMRSDVLGKGFLFIGYSFRDPNVILLFEQLVSAFRQKMPPSYLIAYRYSPEMASWKERFGITVIDPKSLFPETMSDDDAFREVITYLHTATICSKRENEFADLFNPKVTPAQPVATVHEITALRTCVANNDLSDAIKQFRALLDCALIPESTHEAVVDLFVDMARKCATQEESRQMESAVYHLELPVQALVRVMAALMATAHVRDKRGANNLFQLLFPSVPGEIQPVAAAHSLELLQEWGRSPSPSFWSHAEEWICRYPGLQEESRRYVKEQVNRHWKGQPGATHPLKRAEALYPLKKSMGRSLQQIQADIHSYLPTSFGKPPE